MIRSTRRRGFTLIEMLVVMGIIAMLIGAEKGWLFGVAPFILGGFLKSALAAAVLKGIRIYGGKARLT